MQHAAAAAVNNAAVNIHDLLLNKGSYLFYRQNKLFIKNNGKEKRAKLLRITINNLDKIDIKNKYYLFIFSLDIPDNLELITEYRQKLDIFLNNLREKKVAFKITNPLPRCFFKYSNKINILQKNSLPLSCNDCFELFILKEDNHTAFICNTELIKKFMFTMRGREQIYDYLKFTYGEKVIPICKKCGKKCGIKKLKLNCRLGINKSKFRKHIFNFTSYHLTKFKNIWEYKGDKLFWLWIMKNRHFLNKGYILDNGGGVGWACFGAVGIFEKMNIILLDINKKFLMTAKKRKKKLNVNFPILCADSEILPFKDNSFHGVISNGVIHQLNEVDRYLKEVFRVLAPGGLFFCTFFSHWDTHGVFFPMNSMKRLINLLMNIGFELQGKIRLVTMDIEFHKHSFVFECVKPSDEILPAVRECITKTWA